MKHGDLERLTSVRVADVWKAGVRAAVLARRDGVTRFTYLPEYLATEQPAVATTLPRRADPVETLGGAVPPFFAGLLPEGRRLTGLRRAVKTSADDELSLLLAVGTDTIGDVQVVPQGEEPVRAEAVVEIARDVSTVRLGGVLADAGVIDRVGLPGVQDKVSARMISVPVRRAGERFLLKVSPPEFPHIVENEAYFLKLARDTRMPAPRARVIRDADRRSGLLVQRFDRLPQADGTSIALACEDASQVLGRWPADKYRMDAEEAVVGLAEPCAARVVALRDFFRQLAFAYLTGNGDVHGKNLSILQTREGEWRASPAYDVPATVPYGDTTLALPIQGRTEGVSRRHWLAFADAIGLPERAAVGVLDDLLGRLSGLGDALRDGALPFAQKTTADWGAELRYRRRLVGPTSP